MEFVENDIVKDRYNGQEYYIISVSEVMVGDRTPSQRKRSIIQTGSMDTTRDTIRSVKLFTLKHTISGNTIQENGLRMNRHHWSKVNA